MIHDFFRNMWTSIIEEIGDVEITVEDAQESVNELVLYDILDGSRTTLISKSFVDPKHDAPLFAIGLIHTLKNLGAKSCIILIHTSYNRERGKKEIQRVINIIKSGAELVKQYSMENDIRCKCLCLNEDYELIDVLRHVEEKTQDGTFNAYFIFDYNEEWFRIKEGYDILKKLPNIDVNVRHTKFNFSGGWIPGKMHKSTFLYSQNGASYSNWESDELVAQVAMALLAKKFNEGEGLSKIYSNYNEIQRRYIKREIGLFQKTVYLRKYPKKLFILGSTTGPYQIYY